jgi:hypothetical protein
MTWSLDQPVGRGKRLMRQRNARRGPISAGFCGNPAEDVGRRIGAAWGPALLMAGTLLWLAGILGHRLLGALARFRLPLWPLIVSLVALGPLLGFFFMPAP